MNLIKRISNLLTKSSDENPSQWFQIGSWGKSKERKLNELYYGTVFGCIDVIAQGVASVKPELYEDKDGDGVKDEIVSGHPIQDLFKKSNTIQSGADILYLTSANIDIHGKAYIYPIPNLKGNPIEMLALYADKMKVVKSNTDMIKGYVYRVDGKQIPFDVDEIVPIVRPNPFDQLDGVSTIEMARKEAELDLSSLEYNEKFFERGARPDGVLYTEQEDPIDEGVFERLKKQWNSIYGGKENSHKTVILEQGLKYQQLSLNQKDMDFIQQRKLSRDEILSIFRVPKSIMAIADDVNRANAESGEYVFAKYTLQPRLQMIYDKLNAFLLPMFDDTEGMELSFADPVPKDEKTDSDIRVQEANTIMTINEARAEKGLPEIENGDELYIPLNLVPLSFNQERNDPNDEPQEEPQDEPSDDEQNNEKKLEANLKILYNTKTSEKNYMLARIRFMNKISKQFQNANRQLYTDLIRDIRKTPIDKDIDDEPEIWLKKIMPSLNSFKNLAASVFLRYMKETYEKALEHQNKYYGINVDFDLVNTGAVAWLKERSNYTANSVRDTLINKARKVIARNMDEPEFSIEKAKKAILDKFKEESEYNALRIARTETTNAYESAAYKSYSASNGAVTQVKWLVNEPCEVCEPNRGEVRDLGKEFPTGHLHPAVHPNCQCAVAPYYGI